MSSEERNREEEEWRARHKEFYPAWYMRPMQDEAVILIAVIYFVGAIALGWFIVTFMPQWFIDLFNRVADSLRDPNLR